MTVLSEAIGALQRVGGEALRHRVAGEEELRISELASREDPGLFGPASVAWRIHGDPAMFIGGIRSLLFQSLHPLAMAGVDQHSDYRQDPWGRLNRTGRFIAATTFGSTAAAELSIEAVRRMHRTVRGVDGKGRSYSADDPHLLRWVHLTEVESFLDAFERYGDGRLTDAEKDRYVGEMADVGRRLGTGPVPTDRRGLRWALADYRPELESTPEARRSVRFLAAPPGLPLLARPPYSVIFAAGLTSLPRYAQWLLRAPVLPLVEPLAVRPSAIVLTRTLGWFMSGTHRSEQLESRLYR